MNYIAAKTFQIPSLEKCDQTLNYIQDIPLTI